MGQFNVSIFDVTWILLLLYEGKKLLYFKIKKRSWLTVTFRSLVLQSSAWLWYALLLQPGQYDQFKVHGVSSISHMCLFDYFFYLLSSGYSKTHRAGQKLTNDLYLITLYFRVKICIEVTSKYYCNLFGKLVFNFGDIQQTHGLS